MSRLAAIGGAAFAALALTIGASLVSAHARLDESTPAVGEVLAASPPQVSITFTQDVQKITGTYGIDVLDESGMEVTTDDAVLSDEDRRIMTVDLPPNLPAGRYIVEYRSVSDEDGDPFAGAYPFYVGREPTPAELAADEELLGQDGETPTAAAEETPVVSMAETPAVSPTPATPVDDDDDTGGTITLLLVVGAILLVVLLVVAGFIALSRRPAG